MWGWLGYVPQLVRKCAMETPGAPVGSVEHVNTAGLEIFGSSTMSRIRFKCRESCFTFRMQDPAGAFQRQRPAGFGNITVLQKRTNSRKRLKLWFAAQHWSDMV